MAVTPNSVITPQTINSGTRCLLSTAMTNTKAYDGTEATTTAMNSFFTAGVNGSIVDGIRIQFTATDGSTATGTTAASVMRFWMNNGSVNTTAANNVFLFEVQLPATTLTALATTVNSPIYITTYLPKLPAGYKLFAGITVAMGGVLAVMPSVISAGDL
jgi:hypothetical protein